MMDETNFILYELLSCAIIVKGSLVGIAVLLLGIFYELWRMAGNEKGRGAS